MTLADVLVGFDGDFFPYKGVVLFSWECTIVSGKFSLTIDLEMSSVLPPVGLTSRKDIGIVEDCICWDCSRFDFDILSFETGN